MIRSRVLILSIGSLVLAASAQAQYSVQLGAAAWSDAYYNYNAHVGGYTILAPFGGASASATPDSTGLATSAFVTVAGNGPGYPHDPGTFDSLSSKGDLASVTQKMSEFDTGTNDFYTGADGGSTISELDDHLMFNVAGANGSTVTTIGYTHIIRGSLRQSGSNPTGHGELSDTLNLVGAGVGANVDIQLNDVGHPGDFEPYVNGAGGSGTFTTLTPDLVIQTGTFNITGTSLATGFQMDQSSWAYDGMMENYTQSFQFTLPTNVTITSSSGVFGTKAVPEPATIAMLSIGLVGILRRRRA